MKKIIILISGRGTNMKAIVEANIKQAKICAIISNNLSNGYYWAKNNKLNAIYLDNKSYQNKTEYENELINIIDSYKPDFIILAGYMLILSENFCMHYPNKIINIHPSLLPSFIGLNTHQRALNQGCKITGITIHFVTPHLDNGPIIAQIAIPIANNDTKDSLAKRVLKYENKFYPQVITKLINNNFIIKENRVIINNNALEDNFLYSHG